MHSLLNKAQFMFSKIPLYHLYRINTFESRYLFTSQVFEKMNSSIQVKWNKKTERFIGKMTNSISGIDNNSKKLFKFKYFQLNL